MSLAEWEKHYRVVNRAGSCPMVFSEPGQEGHNLLWSLTDYRVSSFNGSVVHLVAA